MTRPALTRPLSPGAFVAAAAASPPCRPPVPSGSRFARCGKAAAALSTLLAAVLLGGCGPGIGGTGTGAVIELTTFGAQPLSVCSSELAPALSCSSFVISAGPAGFEAGGTALLRLDTADGRVTLRLSGNRVELEAPCLSLRFDGTWGQVGQESPLFLGGVLVGNDPAPRPALLRVTLETGRLLRIELRDTAGTVLLGPLTVQRSADGSGSSVSCGG